MLRRFLAQLLTSPARAPQRAVGPTLREAFDALLDADRYEAALALATQALAQHPQSFEAQLLAARAHQKLHDAARALELFACAERQRLDDAELHDFRGSLLQELGRLPEAFADFDRALALRPDFPLAAYHRAMARLLVGDFERGWPDYELRRLSPGHASMLAGMPRWDGAPLAGRTLFVAREQGLGDELMFASLLPEVIAQAGRCIVECDPRLVTLFRRSFPGATFFGTPADGRLPPDIARVDLAIEAGSLPVLLRRRAADFPGHRGYLRADAARVAHWRERLAAAGPALKVGIAWRGGVRRTRRALRSLSPAQLLPLLRVPGVRWVSLEYDDASEDIGALRAGGVAVEHWPEAIEDYDETSALVCALDLVISVCTSVAHLTGALGRPVWVMAPLSPEWRYGFAGDSMPWYPSVRLFRQAEYRRWEPVVAAVAASLGARATPATPAELDDLRRQGAVHAQQERYAEAIEVLRKAFEQARGHAATANLLGYCCSLAGRYDEAMACYKAALDAEPAHADALANAGWTATLRGRGDANPYFRKWLTLDGTEQRGALAGAPRERLALPEVTLACVDCAYHELAARALRATLARCAFGRALFLSDRDCGVEGVDFVPIERISSLAGYSNFMVHRLHEHVSTAHVLVIQYDGFVLNPAAWDPEFLAYDYIGPAVRFGDGRAGGIGGFSLRSRKLLAALRDDPQVREYDAQRAPYAEDIAICCAFRDRLESRHGIRFAPGELADRFAAEAIAPTAGSFGFHNLMHLVNLAQHGFRMPGSAAEGMRITFRADSPLGPISAEREIELRARGDLWASFIPAA